MVVVVVMEGMTSLPPRLPPAGSIVGGRALRVEIASSRRRGQ